MFDNEDSLPEDDYMLSMNVGATLEQLWYTEESWKPGPEAAWALLIVERGLEGMDMSTDQKGNDDRDDKGPRCSCGITGSGKVLHALRWVNSIPAMVGHSYTGDDTTNKSPTRGGQTSTARPSGT